MDWHKLNKHYVKLINKDKLLLKKKKKNFSLYGKKNYIQRSLKKKVHIHNLKEHQRYLKHLNRNKNRRDTPWLNKIKLKKNSHITILRLDKNPLGGTIDEQNTSRTNLRRWWAEPNSPKKSITRNREWV